MRYDIGPRSQPVDPSVSRVWRSKTATPRPQRQRKPSAQRPVGRAMDYRPRMCNSLIISECFADIVRRIAR